MVLFGATGRNSGKTTAACDLIRSLAPLREVWALKVTTADRSEGTVCHRGGEGCGACLFNEPFILAQEDGANPDKDTSRLLAAGAKKSYWLRSDRANLADGFKAFLAMVPEGAAIVSESNTLREFVWPGFFVIVVNNAGPPKPTAQRVIELADLIIESDGIISEDNLAQIRSRATLALAKASFKSPSSLLDQAKGL